MRARSKNCLCQCLFELCHPVSLLLIFSFWLLKTSFGRLRREGGRILPSQWSYLYNRSPLVRWKRLSKVLGQVPLVLLLRCRVSHGPQSGPCPRTLRSQLFLNRENKLFSIHKLKLARIKVTYLTQLAHTLHHQSLQSVRAIVMDRATFLCYVLLDVFLLRKFKLLQSYLIPIFNKNF